MPWRLLSPQNFRLERSEHLNSQLKTREQKTRKSEYGATSFIKFSAQVTILNFLARERRRKQKNRVAYGYTQQAGNQNK